MGRYPGVFFMIRTARIADAEAILELVNFHAEKGQVLFRSLAGIREHIANTVVSVAAGRIVGTCSLKYGWDMMVEIRSLAVDPDLYRQGVASGMVREVIARAERTDHEHIFVLTYAVPLFEKLGFHRVEKAALPLKIWSDCSLCNKREDCDEIAMVRSLAKPSEGYPMPKSGKSAAATASLQH